MEGLYRKLQYSGSDTSYMDFEARRTLGLTGVQKKREQAKVVESLIGRCPQGCPTTILIISFL